MKDLFTWLNVMGLVHMAEVEGTLGIYIYVLFKANFTALNMIV